MENFINWFSEAKNLVSFFSQAFSTLLGAFIAFLLGIKLYKHQKNHENLGYLQYAISSLIAISNNLYLFKDQIVLERYREALEIEDQINNPNPDTKGIVNLEIKSMTVVMLTPGFHWQASMEKLNFLTNRDPNVILILGVMSSSVGALNSIISTINTYINEAMKGDHADTLPTFLIENTKNLNKQVDSAIYLVEKCIDLLITYGNHEYPRKMKITGHNLMNKQSINLKPDPISSWENRNWFPPKKDGTKKVFLDYVKPKKTTNCLIYKSILTAPNYSLPSSTYH